MVKKGEKTALKQLKFDMHILEFIFLFLTKIMIVNKL